MKEAPFMRNEEAIMENVHVPDKGTAVSYSWFLEERKSSIVCFVEYYS